MRFEWDAEKANANLRKHRTSFDEAATVFLDPLSATFIDPDHSVGERRFITVGMSSKARLLVVAHSDGNSNHQRKTCQRHERKRHEN